MPTNDPRPLPICRRSAFGSIITLVPQSVSPFVKVSWYMLRDRGYRFINSMPMVFAFRIVDCFFCMGPKVLFQVGYVLYRCQGLDSGLILDVA